MPRSVTVRLRTGVGHARLPDNREMVPGQDYTISMAMWQRISVAARDSLLDGAPVYHDEPLAADGTDLTYVGDVLPTVMGGDGELYDVPVGTIKEGFDGERFQLVKVIGDFGANTGDVATWRNKQSKFLVTLVSASAGEKWRLRYHGAQTFDLAHNQVSGGGINTVQGRLNTAISTISPSTSFRVRGPNGGEYIVEVSNGIRGATLSWAKGSVPGDLQVVIEEIIPEDITGVERSEVTVVRSGDRAAIPLEFAGILMGGPNDGEYTWMQTEGLAVGVQVSDDVAAGDVIIIDPVVEGGARGATVQEHQSLIPTGSPVGGTFVVLSGPPTDPAEPPDATASSDIDWDASAPEVQTALEGVYGVGNVLVTGPDGGTWEVYFVGDLDGVDVALMTTDPSNLETVPSSPATTIADGDTVSVNENQQYFFFSTPISGDYTITVDKGGTQTTAPIAFDGDNTVVEAAIEALSNITNVTVIGSGTSSDPFDITFLDDFDDIPLIVIDPSNLRALSTANVTVFANNAGSVGGGQEIGSASAITAPNVAEVQLRSNSKRPYFRNPELFTS